MILKIAGLLYIFYIVIVYLVIIIFDERPRKMFKDKKQRKDFLKTILSLIILIPIMPFVVLAHFLENEYNLYL